MDNRIWPRGIYPSGRGLRIKIFHGGKVVYQETVPGDPYSKAHIAATKRRRDELTARLKLGLSLGEVQAAHEGLKTFAEAAQEYLNALDVKDATSVEYLRALNRYWVPAFAKSLISEITAAQIKEVLASHAITGKTKSNALIPLRGVFHHAGINPSPADGIRPKKDQKAPIHRYRPEERDKLIAELKGHYKTYFAILFGCGLRPGEALALRWDCWDGTHLLVKQVISRGRLRNSTKTNHFRRVYVPTWVRTHINELPSRFAGGFLFLNADGNHFRNTDNFNEAWQAAHKRLRIPYRIPYVCRHTRAAELLSVGESPARAAKQLGHSLQMFLNIYSEFIEEYADADDSKLEGVRCQKTDKFSQNTQ